VDEVLQIDSVANLDNLRETGREPLLKLTEYACHVVPV
jgi:hypothetical protein